MQGFLFDGDELTHDPFGCICGRRHAFPIRKVLVGDGTIQRVPEILTDLELGLEVVLVSDENTWAAAGERVAADLTSSGYQVTRCHFDTHDPVKPDEKAVGALMLAMEATTDLLIAVGSGSLTDLTRFVSARTGVPFVSVGTAPSMDGYAGNGAPMTQGGHKRTILATHAQAVILDTQVLADAPQPMVASGYADTLAKLYSRIDWQLSQTVTGEYYCPVLVDGVTTVAQACWEAAPQLNPPTREGIETLSQGLILSGVAMLLAENSRPASGSEHSLSHFWEMRAQAHGLPEHFHGTKVGVGSGIMAAFVEEFRARDPRDIDLTRVQQQRRTREAIEANLATALGPAANGIIREVTRPCYQEWSGVVAEIEVIQSRWDEIVQLTSRAPGFDSFCETMDQARAPWRPADIDLDASAVQDALLLAQEVRSRYTLLRAADTLGWLPEIADAVVDRLDRAGGFSRR